MQAQRLNIAHILVNIDPSPITGLNRSDKTTGLVMIYFHAISQFWGQKIKITGNLGFCVKKSHFFPGLKYNASKIGFITLNT